MNSVSLFFVRDALLKKYVMVNRNVIYRIFHLHMIVLSYAHLFVGRNCIDSNGIKGTCRAIKNCPSAQEKLLRGISPVVCGLKIWRHIVCCSSPHYDTGTAFHHQMPPRNTGEIAKYWCEKYIQICYKPTPFIVGGTDALNKEFPHMAAIGTGNEDDIKWHCGGTLISENFVLTAAHCLSSFRSGPARWVLLGTEFLINSTASGGEDGQIHPVVQRISHPDYRPPSKYHDIALLQIGSAVTPNPTETITYILYPACLPTVDWPYSSHKAIATGWGRIENHEEGSAQLLKVEMDIIDLAKCNEAYKVEIRRTNWLSRGVDATMICAGVEEGGKDTCEGDSGGPLQYHIPESCVYEIRGITAFGKLCGSRNSPAVYIRVSEYVPWIESIVWQ